MRKSMMLALVLLLCITMACPVFADSFVPSIGYKDGPQIEDAEMDGQDVTDCLIVSSLKDAEEKSTDIPQESRDLLLDVYQQFIDGTMELPLDGDYVIRELVDVSFRQEDCIEQDHGHKQWLEQEDTTVTVRFDLGVKEDEKVEVLVYIDGQWVPVENVVNNGDGTVTCEFEDICPVVFCLESGSGGEPPKTGDAMGRSLYLWFALMAASLVALLVLVLNRRKFLR